MYIFNVPEDHSCVTLIPKVMNHVPLLQWNPDKMKCQGTDKRVCYNKGAVYQGTFPYILLLLG